MSADIIQTMVVGSISVVGAGFLGMTAWSARRLFAKVDQVDVLIRGDGNGTPGINERIRDVHAEVKATRTDLKEHADGEEERVAVAMLRFRDENCGDCGETDSE